MTISYDFGLLKSIGDAAGFVARRVEGGLERFKDYFERRGQEIGARCLDDLEGKEGIQISSV